MAAQRHEISLGALKNISRVSAPFELLYDELKVTKCCTKTFCLCWVLRACAQPRRRSVRSIASCCVWNVGRPLSPPPPSLFAPLPPNGLGGGDRRNFRISFYQIFLNGTGLEMCFAILSVIVQPGTRRSAILVPGNSPWSLFESLLIRVSFSWTYNHCEL